MAIHVAAAEQPTLSVVMVLYGGGRLAVDAVDALCVNTAVPFEVIIVDNASPDDSLQVVQKNITGANLLAQPANLGFGAANNLAVSQARGRLICLLNADTRVQPGWFEPLAALLDDATVGAAAPLLLDSSGVVREAGAVVDHWGMTAAPWRCEFAGPTPVPPAPGPIDYASAACLILRRDTFLAVGGFDSDFQLAYYEDVDLCFRLWSNGYQVLCAPQSRVVHFGGATSPSENSEALWHHNRSVFLVKWQHELRDRPSLGDGAEALDRLARWRSSTANISGHDATTTTQVTDTPTLTPASAVRRWLVGAGRRRSAGPTGRS